MYLYCHKNVSLIVLFYLYSGDCKLSFYTNSHIKYDRFYVLLRQILRLNTKYITTNFII